MSTLSRVLLVMSGHVLLLIGLAGVVLPGLPAIPFFILAAICYRRGSPRFNVWMYQHPMLGPAMIDWEKHGSIPYHAKVCAVIMLSCSIAFAFYVVESSIFRLIVILIAVMTSGYILTRPTSRKKNTASE